jgi:hypothetical protein
MARRACGALWGGAALARLQGRLSHDMASTPPSLSASSLGPSGPFSQPSCLSRPYRASTEVHAQAALKTLILRTSQRVCPGFLLCSDWYSLRLLLLSAGGMV